LGEVAELCEAGEGFLSPLSQKSKIFVSSPIGRAKSPININLISDACGQDTEIFLNSFKCSKNNVQFTSIL